jgi:DNA-binding PadR family transcriptional regulator
MVDQRPLTAGEWSVLALVCEQPAHGWALAATLSRDGDIGAIWSLTRPLVYRALEILQARGLIEVAGPVATNRGPNRTVYRPTKNGRRSIDAWLGQPVEHIRDIRPELLLKLVFAQRNGVDITSMLDAQHALIEEHTSRLERTHANAENGAEILIRYQIEASRGALRFVEAARNAALNGHA